MTVFKTFLRVLNKLKVPVIMFTAMLIIFGGLNMKTNKSSMSFVATKPDVLIINSDENVGITKNLVSYIKKKCNIKKIENNKEAIDDALFYRQVNYIIYIPENFREDFLDGKNPEIEVKSTGDYQASLAQMVLERYTKLANSYLKTTSSEEELIEKINEIIENEPEIKITSKLNSNDLDKATFYYNFASYSILAGCVYVICLILSSFNEEKIRKRIIISSMNYKEHNRKLLLSNVVFAIVLWLVYILLSFALIGKEMFTSHGFIYILNSFVFALCSVPIAFLIATLVNNKSALSGIVNVVALGSSFLCGAFVPMELLPDAILKIAHILPTYYYIKNNESIKSLETIEFGTLKPILINMGIILIFGIIFVVLTNIVSKKKRKIA